MLPVLSVNMTSNFTYPDSTVLLVLLNYLT